MVGAHARKLNAAYRVYLRVMEAAGAFALGLIVVVLSAQVAYRYFLSGSLIWAEELSRCMLVWTCFLFAGVAYQRAEMASVDFFTRKLPPRLKAVLMVPALIATMGFLALLIHYSAVYAGQNRMQILPGVSVLWRNLTGSTGGFSIFWVYLAIPIGLSLLLLHTAGTVVRIVLDLRAAACGQQEA